MADPQPTDGRALSDDLPMDEWVKLRDEIAEIKANLDTSPIARWAAGTVAGLGGRVVGVGQGVVHNAEAVADAVNMGNRLGLAGGSMDPSVFREIFDVEKGLLGTAIVSAAHPKAALVKAQDAFDKAQRKVNPWGTPESTTVGGEIHRNYEIGRNQGELGLNTAVTLYRGPKIARALTRIEGPALRGVEKYRAQGFSPEQAEYLAEPDTGKGHHYFHRAWANKLGIPRFIQDNPLNVLHPSGIDRGTMKEKHFENDEHFFGGAIPAKNGGGSWKGKQLGLKKNDPIERIWHGAPDALKIALGGPLAIGLLMYEADKKKSHAPAPGR